jgi:hypothetical protein
MMGWRNKMEVYIDDSIPVNKLSLGDIVRIKWVASNINKLYIFVNHEHGYELINIQDGVGSAFGIHDDIEDFDFIFSGNSAVGSSAIDEFEIFSKFDYKFSLVRKGR